MGTSPSGGGLLQTKALSGWSGTEAVAVWQDHLAHGTSIVVQIVKTKLSSSVFACNSAADHTYRYGAITPQTAP